MSLAKQLKEEATLNLRVLNAKRAAEIIQIIKNQAKQAASQGKFDIYFEDYDLRNGQIRKMVHEALVAEEFSIVYKEGSTGYDFDSRDYYSLTIKWDK